MNLLIKALTAYTFMKMIANGCPILHTQLYPYIDSYAASVKSFRQLSISIIIPEKQTFIIQLLFSNHEKANWIY